MAAAEVEKLIDRMEKKSAPPDAESLLEAIRQVAKPGGIGFGREFGKANRRAPILLQTG